MSGGDTMLYTTGQEGTTVPGGEKDCTDTTSGTEARSVGATVTTESPTMISVSGW